MIRFIELYMDRIVASGEILKVYQTGEISNHKNVFGLTLKEVA